MSDQSDPQIPQRPHSDVPQRHQAARPPIEWPVRNAPQSDVQREKAADLARQRIDRAYTQPTSQPHHQTRIQQPEQRQQQQQPYNWQQYHDAWQQYYHQYFYRYYAGWWTQQKQQLDAQQAAQVPETTHITQPEGELENQKIARELRRKIRGAVEKQSKKVRSSSHFKPILAALTVGSLFLFVNYNQILVGAVKQYITPGNVVTTPIIVEPNASAIVGPEPKIIIPKIGVEAPVIYDEPRVDEASYQAALDRGVVRLGTTPNPGTKGNLVIGGHSSNNVFNAGGFKYVFVNLKRLDEGDIFYLNFEGKRYTYKVTVARKIISPTDVSVLAQTEKPTVTLFTCDPPGTNINRLVVQAEQIDPSPSKAPANTQQPAEVNEANPLPSVAPSLWDRIFRRS